jgi:hypothetical protein
VRHGLDSNCIGKLLAAFRDDGALVMSKQSADSSSPVYQKLAEACGKHRKMRFGSQGGDHRALSHWTETPLYDCRAPTDQKNQMRA